MKDRRAAGRFIRITRLISGREIHGSNYGMTSKGEWRNKVRFFRKTEIPEGYLFSNDDLKKLVVPLIIEQLLAVLVGMSDSIMVAYAGESAMSGVSLMDNIFILVINIFSALATGGAVVAGQYLGMKKDDIGCRAVNQLILFVAISGFAVSVLLLVGQNILLYGVFGKIADDVREDARIYLMITACSIPCIALYNAGAAVFRTLGNSRLPMRISIVMNIINVTGNAILVYAFNMGVAGVAIPTLVSRAFAAVTVLILLGRGGNRLHYARPFRLRFEGGILKKILYIGIPNGVENSMFQLGKILLLSAVSSLGTAAIAANAIGNVITSFQVLPDPSMGLAILAVVSRCVGAGDYKQVRFYTKVLMKKTYIYLWAATLFILAMLPLIMKVYNVSPEAERQAVLIIVYHGIASLILHPLAFAFPSVLRAANDVKYCMIVSTCAMWIFRIAGALVCVFIFHMGVFGIWAVMPIDWAIRVFFFVRRYRSGIWETKRLPGQKMA